MTENTHPSSNATASTAPRLYRLIQIHPSLRCNLNCRHCYSLSGTSQTGSLSQPLVETLVVDAAAQGYDVLNVSGGEPLMWPGLQDVLALAKACGLVTTLTTNLIPATPRRLDRLARVLDLIAVSLDGIPRSHDDNRGKRGAFAAMVRRLPALRESGIPFGFMFMLTENNLPELPWVARFAIEQGAQLLQVHALEEVGRAAEELRGRRPNELTVSTAYLAVLRLRERVNDSIEIRFDFADRTLLRDEPWRGWNDTAPAQGGAKRLADLVSPLVVEADGTVVPLRYGFPRRHALGNLHEAPLRVLSTEWRRTTGYARFRVECEATLHKIATEPDGPPAINWFEAISTWLGGQVSAGIETAALAE